MRLYIDENNDEKYSNIMSTAKQLLRAQDIYIVLAGKEERSSIFQTFLGFFDYFKTNGKLKERVEKIEESLVAVHLDKPRAEIDNELSAAAARLIESLDSVENGVLNLGSLLVIKTDGQIICFNMTKSQMNKVENNPSLLKSPKKLLLLLHGEELSSNDGDKVLSINPKYLQ